MFTNQLRFTGFSGIDTTEMVQQIMRAESVRLDRLRQQRDILVWQQRIYRDTSQQITAFRRNWLDIIGPNSSRSVLRQENFIGLSPTITQGGNPTTGISITSNAQAATGNNTLEVFRRAEVDRFRTQSGTNLNPGAISSGFTMDSLNAMVTQAYNDGEPRDITFRITVNNIARTISLSHSDIVAMRDAVEATGGMAGLAVARDMFVANVDNQLNTMFGSDINGRRVQITADGASGFRIFGGAGHQLATQNGVGEAGISFDNLGFDVPENTGSISGNLLMTTALSDFLGINAIDPVVFFINGDRFEFDGDDSIQTVINAVNSRGLGVSMTFNNITGQFTIESSQTGEMNAITIQDGDDLGGGSGFLSQIFFGNTTTAINSANPLGAGVHIQQAQDALFSFNDLLTTRPTNNFNMNGIQITLNQNVMQDTNVTFDPITGLPIGSGAVFNINMQQDTAAVREMITDFIEAYNELITDMRNITETRRPRTSGGRSFYMPLTDEQRRAMSREEIELWEEQARTGILHRDEVLRQIMNDLHRSLFMNVPLPNGTNFNLLHIGIRTSSDLALFGRLQIDEDALTNALENRLEDVMHLFTLDSGIPQSERTRRSERLAGSGVASRINDILNWTTSTGGGLFERAGVDNSVSANDNFMSRRIEEQEVRINNMMRVLERREASLFARFSRMEVAMMQSQSQQMFLDQLMWGQ